MASKVLLANLNGIVGVVGYYAAFDRFKHAIIATNDGIIHERFWDTRGVFGGPLPIPQFTKPIAGIAGYSSNDGEQHVIVATNDGELVEFWWKPGHGQINTRVLPRLNNIVAISGYQFVDAQNNSSQHLIVGCNEGAVGSLYGIRLDAGNVVPALLRASNSPPPSALVCVAACAAQIVTVTSPGGPLPDPDPPVGPLPDPDPPVDLILYHSVLLATKDGSIQQYVWDDGQPNARPLSMSGQFTNVVGLAQFDQLPDSHLRGVVATEEGHLTLILFTNILDDQSFPAKSLIWLGEKITAIAGFYGSGPGGDLIEHVIVGTAEGNVYEVYWAYSTFEGG